MCQWNLCKTSEGDRKKNYDYKMWLYQQIRSWSNGFHHNLHFACKQCWAKNTWRNTTAVVSEGLTTSADKSRTGWRRQWKWGTAAEKKNKKQRGRVNKKSPQWSWVMAGMRSCGTLHFTRRWDPHQPVSSGFTAMTLWWKPLCCLGCKLRVHTESWALTPKESNTLILCYFFFFFTD